MNPRIRLPRTTRIALFVLCAGAVLPMACQKSDVPAEPQFTEKMTDEEILQQLGLDFAKMQERDAPGMEGSSTIYSNGTDAVIISRSSWSGFIVTRLEPAAKRQTWKVGGFSDSDPKNEAK